MLAISSCVFGQCRLDVACADELVKGISGGRQNQKHVLHLDHLDVLNGAVLRCLDLLRKRLNHLRLSRIGVYRAQKYFAVLGSDDYLEKVWISSFKLQNIHTFDAHGLWNRYLVNSGVEKVVVVDFVASEQEAVESVPIDIDLPYFRSLEDVSVNDFFKAGVPNGTDGAVLEFVL